MVSGVTLVIIESDKCQIFYLERKVGSGMAGVSGAGMQKNENCCRCSTGSHCGKAEDASEAWIVNRTMQSVYTGEVHI